MNEFEKACNEIDRDSDAGECVIEWLKGNKTATVTFPCANKYNTKVKKLAEQYPDEVKICHENKDGSIVAHIPVSYVKISHPKVYSEDARKRMSENFRKKMETSSFVSENAYTGDEMT